MFLAGSFQLGNALESEFHISAPAVSPSHYFGAQTSGKHRAEGEAGAAHPAVVFCLLPGVIGELGKDALATAEDSLEVDRLFRQCWRGLQTELIGVVTQITVVQC